MHDNIPLPARISTLQTTPQTWNWSLSAKKKTQHLFTRHRIETKVTPHNKAKNTQYPSKASFHSQAIWPSTLEAAAIAEVTRSAFRQNIP